jgi:hypothetical protein
VGEHIAKPVHKECKLSEALLASYYQHPYYLLLLIHQLAAQGLLPTYAVMLTSDVSVELGEVLVKL